MDVCPEPHGAVMIRRDFITLFGAMAITWPLMARAQQAERVRLIGILNILGPDDPEAKARKKCPLEIVSAATGPRRSC